MTSQNLKGKRLKPDGGYCSISSVTFGLLWWCLSEGHITSWAVRVGLALFELRIRRAAFVWTEKKAGRGVPEFIPNYSPAELAALCGLPVKRVRSALRELLELGLLAEFSPEEVRFARTLSEVKLPPGDDSRFRSWLESVTKRRRVPIPRRALVLACESSSRSLIAVILGVCVRCSWLRPGEGFSFSGVVSCQWLARRFRLSIRAVQGAKEHLVGLGWIQRTGKVTRFGEAVAINPSWERLIALAKGQGDPRGGGNLTPPAGTNSAGVAEPSGPISAPPSLIQESLPTGEIQNPRRESPGAEAPEKPSPGIFIQAPKREFKTQDPPAAHLPSPRLSAIRPEDFRDVGRALELFRQAVKCGLMPNGSEHSRLLWMAAIERARMVPAQNPAGVFLFVVKGRRWDFLSDGHFEAANARLKSFLHAPPPDAVPFLVPRLAAMPEKPPEPKREMLSKDAELVRLVRERLRGQGSVFAALHNHAGWDRERYAAALAELEAAAPAVGGVGSPSLSSAASPR
jgi:hypothetical protein